MSQETQLYQAERVVNNLGYCDGLAWSRSGYLVVADVRQNVIYRVDSSPAPKPLRENDGGTTGVAFDEKGNLFMAESAARRVSKLDPKGKLDSVVDSFEGKKFNSPNDVVVRRDGNIWFTDPAFGTADDRRELDFYGIFHVSPKGELEAAARWKTRPNGIALSADGKTLYVVDSDRHALTAFDLDKTGAASNQRDILKNIVGVPGGVRLDTDGRFYVAAKGIGVYSPQGKLERTLLEETMTTNCAFGEGDLKSLFVSSRNTVFRIKLLAPGALPY